MYNTMHTVIHTVIPLTRDVRTDDRDHTGRQTHCISSKEATSTQSAHQCHHDCLMKTQDSVPQPTANLVDWKLPWPALHPVVELGWQLTPVASQLRLPCNKEEQTDMVNMYESSMTIFVALIFTLSHCSICFPTVPGWSYPER